MVGNLTLEMIISHPICMHEVLCATDLLSFHMFTHIICPVCHLKLQCWSYSLATKIVLPDKVKSIIAIKDESFIFGIYGAVRDH